MYALPLKMHLVGAIFFITTFCLKQNQSLNTTQFSSNRTIIELWHDTPEYPFHHSINYIWTIGRSHFRLHEKSKDYAIESPTFSIDDEFKWYMELKPYDGKDENTSSLTIKLSPDSKKKKALVKMYPSILDNNGSKKLKNKYDKIFKIPPNGYWYNCIPKEDRFFFNDKLTILVNLTYCEDISNSFRYSRYNTPLWNSSENNFTESLFKNREFADVVLLVNETEHPAHKAVLSLCSPVFAAMFRRAIEKGKKMKRINITDLNDRVVDEMLRYIYTGKCQHLDDLADGLLLAAIKYDLSHLKMICVDVLSNNLTIENAVNTLLFAEKNGVVELKSNAIRFIASKYKDVSETSDWKRLMETKPNIYVQEVCQVFADNNLGGDIMVRKYCT